MSDELTLLERVRALKAKVKEMEGERLPSFGTVIPLSTSVLAPGLCVRVPVAMHMQCLVI